MMCNKHLLQILISAVMSVSLAACSPRSDFNPYNHMSRILTMTTAEQFNRDRDEILEHIDPKFHDEFIASLNGTIYDKYYSKSERTCYTEMNGDTVKLIIEYDCTSALSDYVEVAYFEYQDDILVDYNIYHVEKLMGGWSFG